MSVILRRKHTPVGDTPGKPPPKKQSALGPIKESRKRLSFVDEAREVPGKGLDWTYDEKKALIQYYVMNNIDHWPGHKHIPGKNDTWSKCAEFVNLSYGSNRTGHSCRRMVYRMKEHFDTPDLAWEAWEKEDEDKIVSAFKKLDEIRKVDLIDRLFKIHLAETDMEDYCPGNVPSLSLLAMNTLKNAKRPNTVANLLTCLTRPFEGGISRLDIDRMPYPLIETNLAFFASEHKQAVKVHDTYHQWLATMYAHFGEKFVALYTGPMWKVQKEEDLEHQQVLEKAFRPTTVATSDKEIIPVPNFSPVQAQPGYLSKSTPTQSKQAEFTFSTPLPSEEPCSSTSLPSEVPCASTLLPHFSPVQAQPEYPSKSTPAQSKQADFTFSTPLPSEEPCSSTSLLSKKPCSSTSLPSEEPCSFTSLPSEEQRSRSWMATDLEEIRALQIEGVDIQQRERELIRHHNLQPKRSSKSASTTTKDALVNVVGLSARQLRRDYAKTEYTPGASIQRTILQQAKLSHPQGRWWIKADACDISTGLRESVQHEWSGDVDMGDGKVQKLHQSYTDKLKRIYKMGLVDILQQIKELKEEMPEIKEGLAKADEIYTQKEKDKTTDGRKLPFLWELEGWKDLKKQNVELRKCLKSTYNEGKRENIPDLKSELFKYQKGIYMKRRKMATHLLIFMISDELRNRKPYAIPVWIMPITAVKDLEIRKMQVDLKTAMNEEDMEVIGFVTDGEWNSLRTMGSSRPTSLVQLVMQAKDEAKNMTCDVLEKILKPNIELNPANAQEYFITPQVIHEAVPIDDLGEIAKDILRGLTFNQALPAHHKRIYPHVLNPLPWTPGASMESPSECMRSIMAKYLLKQKIKSYKQRGIDFTQNVYVPELATADGADFDDREDHGHLFKRIVKVARLGEIPDCDLSRWIEALQDANSGLTAKALRGVDPQSVPDAERVFGKGVINFLESKGYTNDAKFAQMIHNWHKATDGRGLSEEQRSEYNNEMLNYILDEWMPFHRTHHDFSEVDMNKPLAGIRGLSRETIVGITTNISSQEQRRKKCQSQGLPPEHPRASTSDDVEGFISLLHHMLGRIFDHKTFMNSYRKIFMEFQKMLDTGLPFYYYQGPKQRYTIDPLPSFNVPSSGRPERLDRVPNRRLGNVGCSVSSRATMPRQGQKTIRDKQYHREEPFPPVLTK